MAGEDTVIATVIVTSSFLLLAIFVAGVLHGLGPDHLAAITAFGGRDARRVVFFYTRFAFGHVVIVALAGLLAKFSRQLLPVAWEHRFDLLTGWLLVVTGAGLLIGFLTGRVSLHAHVHAHHTDVAHGHSGSHRHFHLHWFMHQQHQHVHGGFAAVLGALFALGGVRSLLAIVPIALAQTLAESVLRILVFALGIVASMVAYGLAAQHLLTRSNSPRWIQASSYVAALFCVAAGVLVIGGYV